jgi:hypothetical protein
MLCKWTQGDGGRLTTDIDGYNIFVGDKKI